jgi:hypothetical protein
MAMTAVAPEMQQRAGEQQHKRQCTEDVRPMLCEQKEPGNSEEADERPVEA